LTGDIPTNATYDAARALLGGYWKMSTKEDFQELYDNTDREWTAINGVNGWKFMKKTDHSVFVFFPAAGYYNSTSLNYRGTYGYSWSSSFYSATKAYNLNFGSSLVNTQGNSGRFVGITVRPICKPNTDITITLNPTDQSSVSGVAVTVTDSEGTSQTATTNA
jgi:hypothetical protein